MSISRPLLVLTPLAAAGLVIIMSGAVSVTMATAGAVVPRPRLERQAA